MTTLQQYITDTQNLVHDTNGANFTTTQMINFVNQARQRVAIDCQCVRGFLPFLNTITQQETYLYNGTIGGVEVTNPGSGYTSAPTVSFTGGGGTGAAAQAIIAGGAIQNIFMTNWGTGYSTVPTLHLSGGGGTGGAGIPTLLYNVLDILSISVIWGNLRVMLGWLPFTQFQAWLRAYTFNFSQPDGIWTSHEGIQKVFTYPISDQPYVMEWDIITMPNPLVNLTDNDTQIIAPWDDAVKFFAAHLCIASLQNYAMADYWYDGKGGGKYDLRIKQLPATKYVRRIFDPYATGIARMRRMR